MIQVQIARGAMPKANDKLALADEAADFRAAAIEMAVNAIGAGLEAKGDVIAHVAYAYATRDIEAFILKGEGKAAPTIDDLRDDILVGTLTSGKPIFQNEPQPAGIIDSASARRYLLDGRASKRRLLRAIGEFLTAAKKVAATSRDKSHRAAFLACIGKATRGKAKAAYIEMVRPIVAEVLAEVKKLGKPRVEVELVDAVKKYLDGKALGSRDIAALIVHLNDKASEIAAQEAAIAAMSGQADTEEEEDDELLAA